jgi:hypothetical protein
MEMKEAQVLDQTADKRISRREFLAEAGKVGKIAGGVVFLTYILGGKPDDASAKSTVKTKVNEEKFLAMIKEGREGQEEAKKANAALRDKWRKKLKKKKWSTTRINAFLDKHFPTLE